MSRFSLLNEYRSTKAQMKMLENIADAPDCDHAWDTVASLMQYLGFSYCGIGLVRKENQDIEIELPHSTEFFGKSFREYHQNMLHLKDPTAVALHVGQQTVLASHTFRHAPAPLRDGAQKVAKHFREDAIADHCAMRIDLPENKAAACLAFGLRDGAKSIQLSKLVDTHKGLLNLVGTLYAGCGRGTNAVGGNAVLSKREAIVLGHLASGLSVQEIAEEEGRAVATIRAQLASARSRLGARSSAHAVLLGLQCGAIRG